MELLKRLGRCYCYYDDDDCDCNNAWDDWARWLVLALIIIGAFLIFFIFSCISARRRRRLGYQPYRGTGWAAGRTPAGHGTPSYNAQPYYQNQQPYYNNSSNAPPAYTPPPNNGWYGQQNDVELQQPNQTYGGYRSGVAQNVYEPPKGPPPGHS